MRSKSTHGSSPDLHLRVHNMHCAACAVRIERMFRMLPGVRNARVNHATGHAVIAIAGKGAALRDFHQAIAEDGYSVTAWHDRAAPAMHGNTRRDYAEIAAAALFFLAAYLILGRFDLLPRGLGIGGNMSYGFVFVVGVVAAFSSCLAVTGGLLLAVAAKYNERHPALGGWQKCRPTLWFNVGRVISYTLLGGVVGGVGSVFTLSPAGTGILSILASLVMIALGLQLLNLFPWLRRFQPTLPKALAHRIHDLGNKDGNGRSAPLVLGGLTFFLPCGFTQALQFYVLSTGSPLTGALTMLAFALGTLPSLLSLSMISSFARGAFQTHFLHLAGVLVVLVGVWNIGNGLTLASIALPWSSFSANRTEAAGAPVPIVGGVQVAKMSVDGYDFSPSQFTVQAGVPVRWEVDGRNAAGCAQVLLSSSLGVARYLSPDHVTAIGFTPQQPGRYGFSCSMGMTTPGAAFTVLPPAPGDPVVADATGPAAPATAATPVEGQKLRMEISEQRGFYPNSFTVRKDVPVTLDIDDKVPLDGCTSVMVIPEYDVTLPFRLGPNRLSFTPTKAGTIYGICSMGSKMIRFVVVG